MKPLERVQQRARELATSNLGKDRRSIDQVQREIKGARVVDDDRDFFDGPRRGTGNGKSEGKRKQVESRITPEDSSYVINKMGLLADEREYKSRNGHNSKASASVPSKRRRRSLSPSDASDASSQDFDSDDLDDVDVRRKKKKKQSSTIGASTRRREEAALPRKRPPAGGSVLAAAGLDIYAMFGRKDRELWVPFGTLISLMWLIVAVSYLSRDRASDSEDDMEADAATIRKEEARAARQAREDDRREEAEERRRAEEKRRRKERERGR